MCMFICVCAGMCVLCSLGHTCANLDHKVLYVQLLSPKSLGKVRIQRAELSSYGKSRGLQCGGTRPV